VLALRGPHGERAEPELFFGTNFRRRLNQAMEWK